MWISGGDQEISENIVHMVLAKIPGSPPGVKGISLFIVPKYLVAEDGGLGARNGVVLAGLNHKMGYRGTTNTLLNFGENTPCTGYLIGEENKGLSYMFQMMNEARIGVGLGATALGAAGYRASLAYAKERPQGRHPDGKDATSPQIAIIEHADIRRLLLAQKAAVEGALALLLQAALLVDTIRTGSDPAKRREAELLLDLLTPIAKSWPSEFCLEANKHAIQVLGGRQREQIQQFLAVAELGSFSRASKRLGTAQPALSQAIRDLEAELSVRLFDRTTRRVELTDAGREFQNSTTKVMEELQHAVEGVHMLAERRRGRLRIAAPPLLASVVLPQAIAEFQKRHPGITVQLADVGTEQIVESVRSGKADCGLGTFSPAEDGIERLSLVRDSLMLFCDHRSHFNEAATVTWRELADRPLITLTRDSGIRLLVEVGFEMAEIPFKPSYEVTQVTTAIALVEAGLGIAVLPTYA
ncbi:LysR substrate-binding domain-containing protein, partial [Rhizobiaceae sp. 2RAB30]